MQVKVSVRLVWCGLESVSFFARQFGMTSGPSTEGYQTAFRFLLAFRSSPLSKRPRHGITRSRGSWDSILSIMSNASTETRQKQALLQEGKMAEARGKGCRKRAQWGHSGL